MPQRKIWLVPHGVATIPISELASALSNWRTQTGFPGPKDWVFASPVAAGTLLILVALGCFDRHNFNFGSGPVQRDSLRRYLLGGITPTCGCPSEGQIAPLTWTEVDLSAVGPAEGHWNAESVRHLP